MVELEEWIQGEGNIFSTKNVNHISKIILLVILMLREYFLLCQCNWLELEASTDRPGKLKGRGDLRDAKSPFSSSLSSESPKRWLLSNHIFMVIAIPKLPNIHIVQASLVYF